MTNDNPHVIDGLLRQKEVMLLGGPQKCGMSMMALQLALAVATGGEWLGFKTDKRKVLYIDNELNEETATARARTICAAREIEPPEKGLSFVFRRNSLDSLVDSLRHAQSDSLIVIDPLQLDEAGVDYAAGRTYFNQLDFVARDRMCAIVLVARTQSGDSSDARSAAARAVDTIASLGRDFCAKPYDLSMSLWCQTRSFERPQPRSVRFNWPLWSLCTPEEKA